MKYNLSEENLKLLCINLSDEIKGDDELLNNEDVTIFNSSILQLKNSDDLLIASRGWYGNIRSWDGLNFIILSLFTKDLIKIDQNILDIDKNVLNDKKRKFKELKKEVIPHGDTLLKGPEDPRLFYHNDDIYILLNDLTEKNKRHMFVSKIDLQKLEYSEKIELCEELSTSFEKNWGPFHYDNKLHMLYDINPLKIYELEDDFECKLKFSVNNEILKKLTETYPELHFHIRNSTNLIPLNSKEYLGLGHGVLDYKNKTDINHYLIPLIGNSEYSETDKEYFKRFYKLYTGFFFKMNMEKQKITHMSPFFQLPNYESKQELIFFPTSIGLNQDDYIVISYNVGDNRSYYLKLHLDVIKLSLYDKKNIDFLVNYNINPNYFIELMRNLRKLLGFSTLKKDYYKFGDVNRIYSGKRSKNNCDCSKRNKTKSRSKNKKRKSTSKKTRKNKKEKKTKDKLIYFYMEGCRYCVQFEPIWNKLKENKDKNIKFMKINGPKNKKITNKYGVEGYPTILLIRNNLPILFNKKRTYKNLQKFIS